MMLVTFYAVQFGCDVCVYVTDQFAATNVFCIKLYLLF